MWLKLLIGSISVITKHVEASCWRETVCTGPASASFPGSWENNIHSPASRLISPKHIFSGSASSCVSDYKDGSRILGNNDAGLVYDFGIEVGGIINLNYTVTDGPTAIGLAFAESKSFVGPSSDHSNAGSKSDGYLLNNVTIEGSGTYTMPTNKLRGGFRYLTIFQLGGSMIEITGIRLEISFQPTWENLRAYQGYFDSSDVKLNKLWYAGAYTIQTNFIAPTTDRSKVSVGWSNDVTVGVGSTILVDGAKRDRWIWPGDMGVAIPSTFASIGDMESIKNSLQTIYDSQSLDGELPMAGPPYNAKGSDTYHMWTLIGTYQYILFTDDLGGLATIWPNYLTAVSYIYNKVDVAGILQATGTSDWGRMVNAINGSAPNMLLYRTLTTGAYLANLMPDGGANLSSLYSARARDLKQAIQNHLWDANEGAFKDAAVPSSIYPQDGNSMAVAFGIVTPRSAQANSISNYLMKNWTPIGPKSPELPNNISPFISSIELIAHFNAGHPDRALELMKTCWGWYLNNPNGTQSTFVEGYLQDGTFLYRGNSGYRNDASYISHAHGWSSGPTSALTEFLVGLWPIKNAGAMWELRPNLINVTMAEAGFTTPLGKFSAKWTIQGNTAVLEWNTPARTLGVICPRNIDVQSMTVEGGKGSLNYTLSSR